MSRGKPPVGLPVQYFSVPSKDCPPAAATVIRQFEGGSVDLLIHTPSGGHAHRKGVFLFGDPELDKRKDTEWASQTGVWDYIPGTPRLGEVSNEELEAAAQLDAEEADRVRKQRVAERKARLEQTENPPNTSKNGGKTKSTSLAGAT